MSKTTFLSFEQPIAELESKIEELRFVQEDSAVDITEEIDRLSQKSQQLTKDIYAKLTPWQVSQIARHPQRPYTMDYVNEIFTDFHELHGDRSVDRCAGRPAGSRRSFAEQKTGCPDRKMALGGLGPLPGGVELGGDDPTALDPGDILNPGRLF